MAKYKVGDKVEIIDNRNGSLNSVGDVGEIVDINVRHDGKWHQVKVEGKPSYSNWSQVDEIPLVERKLKIKERLAKAEETIAKQGEEINELKVIVEGLRKSKFNVEADAETVAKALAETLENVIEFEGAKYHKVEREAREGDVVVFEGVEARSSLTKDNKPYAVTGTKSYQLTPNSCHYNVYGWGEQVDVDVYERIEPSTSDMEEQTVKSPNELRAEVIEKAKQFVTNYSKGEQRVPWKCGTGQWYLQNFDFVINEAKRTIVVLCKSIHGGVYERGIAKCMPNDVFNSHIGKAIALGRALGLDVSEFEGAVQPTFAVGQTVVNNGKDDNPYVRCSYVVSEIHGDNVFEAPNGWTPGKYLTILNDTNAIYSEVLNGE